jgi:hypothetical protein
MDVQNYLYHVSRRIYEPEQVIEISSGQNAYSTLMEVEGKDWVSIAFERLRPSHLPPRALVQYAFDDPGGCRKFAEGENAQRGRELEWEWHYYQVEMPNPSRHPFELLEWVYRYGEEEEDEEIADVVREYWEPTQHWRRYEYLDRRMKIVRAIDPPEPIAVWGPTFRSASDRTLCKHLWPQLLLRMD